MECRTDIRIRTHHNDNTDPNLGLILSPLFNKKNKGLYSVCEYVVYYLVHEHAYNFMNRHLIKCFVVFFCVFLCLCCCCCYCLLLVCVFSGAGVGGGIGRAHV